MKIFKCDTVIQVGVVHLLYPNLVLVDVVQHLLLGEALLVLPLQPVGEADPLVLAGLQTAALLNHLQPLLRGGLLHADALHGPLGVGDEDLLVAVRDAEPDVLVLRVEPLGEGNHVALVVSFYGIGGLGLALVEDYILRFISALTAFPDVAEDDTVMPCLFRSPQNCGHRLVYLLPSDEIVALIVVHQRV